MGRIPFFLVDAFTAVPFHGNPAAVCLPDGEASSELMQRIANEMNLSETAFVLPEGPAGLRRLRWFTPALEVPLCGHATLATAHVLFGTGAASPLRFDTASGVLDVHREADGSVRMDFPADPPAAAQPPPGLLEALGLGRSRPTYHGRMTFVVRLESAAEVEGVQPDMAALSGVVLGSPVGLSVTAPGLGQVDFVSRFFGPWVGVNEDPVTGAAHTTLGPYWASELGKSTMLARQLSRRGGELRVQVDGTRVHLTGHAVTIGSGTLLLP